MALIIIIISLFITIKQTVPKPMTLELCIEISPIFLIIFLVVVHDFSAKIFICFFGSFEHEYLLALLEPLELIE